MIKALLLELCAGEGIVRNLEILGIKGERARCGTCPVAIYLKATTGGSPVSVGQIRAHVGCKSACLPKDAADFVLAFDRGCYPQLETTYD